MPISAPGASGPNRTAIYGVRNRCIAIVLRKHIGGSVLSGVIARPFLRNTVQRYTNTADSPLPGADRRIQTLDPLSTNQPLYRLSYASLF